MSKNFRSITVAFALCSSLLLSPVAFAASHRGTTYSSTASRPYYGGGHHTTSHGGSYSGETNAKHKNGHYQNWGTGNRYGVHKP